ncbi:MAG TPA: hypothetical protein VMX95_08685 [Thermodesulfobacteriota bacterium]|nr:hypothetical protein [Thermodesulfobacteriota bacterium]
MSIDINTFDIGQMIFNKLQGVFGEFKETEFKSFTKSEIGGSKRYVPGGKTKVPFESLIVTRLFDVDIRNLRDRNQLDRSNTFVNLLMPADAVPLPLYACDVDVHKGKYVHVITDMVPLSKNPEYRNMYEIPLKNLKEKYKDLPGMVVKTPEEIYKIFPAMKEFESYSSSGRIFGNIPIEHAQQIMNLIEDYLNCYCSFVKGSSSAAILKREEIIQEASETKKAFMAMMSKMDFSHDMPNLPKRSG